MTSVYAFTKRIKEGTVVHRKIMDLEDITKIGQVIQRLKELPKASMLRMAEVKTGKARLTEDEMKLKDLIDCKMVNYVPLSVQRIGIAEEVDTEEIGD